jgi:chorismate mutase
MNQSLSDETSITEVTEAGPTNTKVIDPGALDPAALDPATLEPATLDEDAAAAEISRLREQLDAVDVELIQVVHRRIALSKQIQTVRISHGGRRREHSRELNIVNTYVDGLGRNGSQLALTLLELCRGRA